MSKNLLTLATAAALGTLLVACTMAPPIAEAPPEVIEPVEPEVVFAEPVAMHRFEIAADDDVVGQVQVVVIGEHDTLSDVARRFNVGYDEIVRANPGVDPWLPGVGREVVVPTQFVLPAAERKGIVVTLAALRLFYFPTPAKGEPQVVYTHPIGIGKVGWSTPEGKTTVVSKQKNPTWRPTASILEEHRKNGDPLPAVVPPGEVKEARTGVDPGVEGAGRRHVLRQRAGATAEVEDGLAGLRSEEVHHGGDREVVLAATLAGPADVPVGNGVPAATAFV